jgi:hypothetical protein
MTQNKAMKSMAVSILTTMLAGLVLFFFDFHNNQWPSVKTRIQVLESKVLGQKEYLQRIDAKTQKIYEILIEQK